MMSLRSRYYRRGQEPPLPTLGQLRLEGLANRGLRSSFLSATWCAAAAEPRDSVVKVYVQSLETRYGSPWDGGRVEASSGSGFVIASFSTNSCPKGRLRAP